MGQASTADHPSAVNVPDPNEATAAAPLASADDLLAQLAGEEIDRLLAESESEAAAGASALAADDPSLEPGEAHASEVAGASATSVVETPASMGAEIDAVLNEVEARPPAEAPAELAPIAPPPPPSPSPSPSPSPTPVETPDPAVDLAADQATADAEMRELLEAPVATTDDDLADEEAPLPVYVRPLVWLNAPLSFLPDAMREIIGKVAVLTLCNAVAVLLYVLIFRRHH